MWIFRLGWWAMGVGTVLDAATAVHHTATTDEPWDGPAAVKAMPAAEATLRYCHAWVDPDGDPDAKSTYKFPHHKTKGGPANMAAVRNGLARLSGASIPDGDRAGVERHLRAHLTDGGGGDDDGKSDRLAELAGVTRPRSLRRPAARQQQPGEPGWYRIVNTAAGAEVYLYDEIGFWGVSAAEFVAEFKALGHVPVDMHINSPGGDVFDGVAIYTALAQHPADVTVYIDGLAASAASFIAQAGTRIVMSKPATMMIHDAWGLCIGNADDMRTTAGLLDKLSATIAGVYADRAGGSVDDWRQVMKGEAWYTAAEAVDAGLADEIAPTPAPAGPAPMDRTWDLSIFNYAGRDAAPSPEPVAPVVEPGPEPIPATAWDVDLIRNVVNCLKEAVS